MAIKKNTSKIRVHLNPTHNPYSGAKSNDSKWIKVRKFFIKVSIIAVIGYISRWYINDIFNVNVFVNYNHPLSITYYFSMAGFSTILNELLNILDGSKMTIGGLDLSEDIKYNSGKEITERKRIVNFMQNSPSDSGIPNSSTDSDRPNSSTDSGWPNSNTDNNNPGGSLENNGGQSSSAEGLDSFINHQGTSSITDLRERRVNPMSLTQMCNSTIEGRENLNSHIENISPETVSPETYAYVKRVLDDERKMLYDNNPNFRGNVSLSDLGYNFRLKKGSVIQELIDIKKNKWKI